MTRSVKFLCRPARLAAVAIAAATGLAIPQAQAKPLPANAKNYTVLYTGNTDPTLSFNSSTVIGNIGMGGVGVFSGTTGVITGAVEFSAPVDDNYNPGDVDVAGGGTFGNAPVQTDLNTLNALSQTLGGESGTALNIAAGVTVNASSGILDSGGNEVFTATINGNFMHGTTFTISGTSSQSVVVNIPSTGGLPFDGSIALTGGITPDQVLFNFDSGDYETLSGGDTLTIDTDGNTTTGTFLDPNGPFEIDPSVIYGRVIGGGSSDSSISDSTIIDPVPEPASLALFGVGLLAFGIIRRRHRPLLRR